MFDDKTFRMIRGYWEADQKHPHRGRTKKAIPSEEIFKTLIEESYLASMRPEEGSYNKFSLTYISKEIIDSSPEDKLLIYEGIMNFEKPLAFNAESITKLSPSCDPNNSSFIVESSDSGELMITGAMFFHSPENWLNNIPFGIIGMSDSKADLLMIGCYDLGSLKICRGRNLIGRFVHGNFSIALPTPFYTKAMGNYVIELLKKNGKYKHPEDWGFVRDSLIVLLQEASDRAHGASLVFIPCNEEKYLKDISLKYRLEDKLQIAKIKDFMSDDKEKSNISRQGYKKYLFERLKFLAQLACADGALILTTNFELIGYGSTLNSPKFNGRVIVGPDGFGGGGNEFNINKYGTRHNSMVGFIGNNGDCIGFVLSEDGPIRGFCRAENDTILCWPDCTVSMSAD